MAASALVGLDADEHRAPVARRDRALGQQPADVVALLVVSAGDLLPDLHLAGLVANYGEGHELIERHAVLGVNVEQRGRDGGEFEPLAHDLRADEEARRHVLDALAGVDQRLKGAELVERVEVDPLGVLGEAVLLGRDGRARLAHVAGHGRGLGEALGPHQQLKGAIAPAPGRHLELAGGLTLGAQHRPDVEVLQQATPGDVLGEILDRNAGADATDVRLRKDELVERDVARGRERRDLLNGRSHVGILHDGRPGDPLSTSYPSRSEAQPSSSGESRAGEQDIRKDAEPPNRLYGSARFRFGQAASRSGSTEAALDGGSAPGRNASR